MKTAKIGAMFLISILALAGTGMAYAWWHEDLVIDGTIYTGNIGWGFSLEDYWSDGDSKYVSCGYMELVDYDQVDGEYKGLDFEIYNAFPCVYYYGYWDLHYYGSVPGHLVTVTETVVVNGETLDDIPLWMELGINVVSSTVYDIPTGPYTWLAFVEILEGSQWHQGEKIWVESYIHFTEWEIDPNLPVGTETPQDATIELTITMAGYQYNYVVPS